MDICGHLWRTLVRCRVCGTDFNHCEECGTTECPACTSEGGE